MSLSPSVQPAAFETPAPLRPVTADERLLPIDVLRGFALLGILLVNMAFFSAPFAAILLERPWWPEAPDRVAKFAIRALAEGKFYILFSLLFGLGMALQMRRAAVRGASFARYYGRRLVVLFAFGVAHVLLLWYGDILHAYALLGFLLLLFRRRTDRTVLIWAGVTYLLPIVVLGVLTGLVAVGRALAPDEIARDFAEQSQALEHAAAAAVVAYQTGTWPEIFRQRLSDFGTMLFGWIFIGPTVTAMFLLGLVVGRHGLLAEPERHARLFRGLAWIGLPIGLALNIAYAYGAEVTSPAVPSGIGLLVYAAQWAGAPLLSFGYAAVLMLALRQERWRGRLVPFACVGRMALTTYLLQTVICTTIFYSYGLGGFNRVGFAWTVVLALAIYAVQIPLSVFWLRRFRFGPLEWLWRTLTYGRWQPMRLSAPAAPA